MPVYLLTDELLFPPPEGASEEGVVAVGGDFRPERLLLAYSQGIFPWPTEGFPLLWFSPDPRFVLEPSRLRLSRSLKKAARRSRFTVRADTAFADVIEACSLAPRRGQSGTWITDDLMEGFLGLHHLGFAHSVEAYDADGKLAGGLYGVCLGGCFFGESMFAREPDASKLALLTLSAQLLEWGGTLIDCQVHTAHLATLGAVNWPRARFLARLHEALSLPTRRGRWTLSLEPADAADRIERLQRP
ncbi:MAG: leucyl/phenylalanyl-tRNA--protein transferase [Sandaracinaceae bacterium]